MLFNGQIVKLATIKFYYIDIFQFLSDPGIPGVRSMGPSVSNSLTHPFADLTEVTLADEDTNSTLTNDVNPDPRRCGNVAPPGGQNCK